MYKILSLDGGGSWSVLQLLTLREKYGNASGHDILRRYDMVIANSGGSIILATLAENWTIDEALTLFRDTAVREKVFCKTSFWDRYFPVDYLGSLTGFGPKYSASKKAEAFKTLFPKVDSYQMEELPAFVGNPKLKIIVCTYDALNNKAKFFKSYHSNETLYDSVRLTQAIHGSSNAPVLYFDFPARFKAKQSEIFYELWDGALGGFNNPVVAGIIEAIKAGVPLSEIQIVSIGTGNKTMSVQDKKDFYKFKQITVEERRKKFLFWRLGYQLKFFKTTILNQSKTILYQPPDWANYVAMIFIGLSAGGWDASRLIRLSPMIHVDKNTDPTVLELMEKLYKLDMDLTREEDIALLGTCFEAWKDGKIGNQPIDYEITRDNELLYRKGDRTFKEGLEKWKMVDML